MIPIPNPIPMPISVPNPYPDPDPRRGTLAVTLRRVTGLETIAGFTPLEVNSDPRSNHAAHAARETMAIC